MVIYGGDGVLKKLEELMEWGGGNISGKVGLSFFGTLVFNWGMVLGSNSGKIFGVVIQLYMSYFLLFIKLPTLKRLQWRMLWVYWGDIFIGI